MDAKRRLPMLRSTQGDEAQPERRSWQWVAFGTVAIFVVWLPLAAAALALNSRLTAPSGRAEPTPWALTLFVTTSALGFGLATFVGSFIVGRWGGARAGTREAVLSGLVAAMVAVMATWASFGVQLGALAVLLVPLPFAVLGGKLGRRGVRP